MSKYSVYMDSLSDSEKSELIEEINRLYPTMKRSELADKLNVDEYILKQIISKNNINPKRKSVFNNEFTLLRNSMNSDEWTKFCEEFKYLFYKMSRTSLSNKLGISESTYRRLQKELNLHKTKKEITDTSKITFETKYGAGIDNPMKSPDIRNKAKLSVKKKYGVNSPYLVMSEERNKELRDKINNSLINKIPDNVREIIYDKENFRKFLADIPENERTWNSLYERLGFNKRVVGVQYRKLGLYDEFPVYMINSNYENEIFNYIRDLTDTTIQTGRKDLLRTKNNPNSRCEIDIYIPEFKLGIEFNGVYWHSLRQFNYHQEKSFVAKENGIFIYNIWEYEWNDPRKQEIIKSQIKNLIHKNGKIVYARKCEIKEITPSVCREFLDKNHIQGNRNSSIKLGLFYENELVSVMTFGMNKFIRKNSDDIELLRFCNKCGYSVIGGSSKLFKYFLRNYKEYKRIVSYCDISKGKGLMYENLGFKLVSITSPNYIWINLRSGEIKSRYQCQMKNEKEIMRSKGFIKISDCGSYKFVYNKN